MDLYTDEPAIAITLENTVETPVVGGIASNLWLTPDFDWNVFYLPGTLVNSGGVLIQDATGAISYGSPYVSGVVYSFDYLVPSFSGPFTIGPGEGVNRLSGHVPSSLTVYPILDNDGDGIANDQDNGWVDNYRTAVSIYPVALKLVKV